MIVVSVTKKIPPQSSKAINRRHNEHAIEKALAVEDQDQRAEAINVLCGSFAHHYDHELQARLVAHFIAMVLYLLKVYDQAAAFTKMNRPFPLRNIQ